MSSCREPQKSAVLSLQLTQFSMEVAAEAMFTMSPDGRILTANRSACERLEYSRDELVGMHVADIDPHYPTELWPAHFAELRSNGRMAFETQHRAKSGRIIDVDVSVAYFKFDGVEYCCSSVRDITERKQAERILHLQHEVLAKVASTTGALNETLDELCRLVEKLVPGCMATVMLVDESDGCLRFEAGPALTTTIRQAFEPLRPGIDSGSCGAAAHSKQAVFVEDTRSSPNWACLQSIVQQFNLLACWSLPILDEHHQILGTFAVSHHEVKSPSSFHVRILETASHMASIAVRSKRFEQRLRFAHEELAHVSRVSTIGEMATNIAHELNQPLAAMVNHTFVLNKLTRGEAPNLNELRDHADSIREQALRAGQIVSSVRNLVKKTAPSRKLVDANQIVLKSLVLLEPELRHNGIELRKNLIEPSPLLLADGVQLQQVLVNLVRNAIDAMKCVPREERVLTVGTNILAENEVEFYVTDTGEGLGENQTESVFDTFHTTKPDGMGMGLAISRSIAIAHSGRLTAAHAKERGATFRMTLPRNDAA